MNDTTWLQRSSLQLCGSRWEGGSHAVHARIHGIGASSNAEPDRHRTVQRGMEFKRSGLVWSGPIPPPNGPLPQPMQRFVLPHGGGPSKTKPCSRANHPSKSIRISMKRAMQLKLPRNPFLPLSHPISCQSLCVPEPSCSMQTSSADRPS